MQSIGAEPSQLPQANGRCVTLPSQREAIYATAKLRLDVCKSFNACYTSSLCMIQLRLLQIKNIQVKLLSETATQSQSQVLTPCPAPSGRVQLHRC
jgi:hypothetical protein